MSIRTPRTTFCVAIAGVISSPCILPAMARAADASPSQILAAFNSERTANGLPANVTENAEWSARCAAHNHYLALNNQLQHPEDPALPGYSVEGNWGGTHAVLSQGTTWLRADPWLNAPIHLNQMMSPLLVTTGVAESENRNCLTTFEGYANAPWSASPTPELVPAVDTLYAFPGNGQQAAFAQTADEAPHTPGEWIGIPNGRRTGPYLIVYWNGPQGDPNPTDQLPPTGYDGPPGSYVDPTPPALPLSLLTAGTVTGPTGDVPAAVLNTQTHRDDGYYLAPNSGFVVPLRPLTPGASYLVTATFSTDPTQTGAQRSWTGSYTVVASPRELSSLGPADKNPPVTRQRPATQSDCLSASVTNRRVSVRALRRGLAVRLRSCRTGRVQIRLLRPSGSVVLTSRPNASRTARTIHLRARTTPGTLVLRVTRGKRTVNILLTVRR